MHRIALRVLHEEEKDQAPRAHECGQGVGHDERRPAAPWKVVQNNEETAEEGGKVGGGPHVRHGIA